MMGSARSGERRATICSAASRSAELLDFSASCDAGHHAIATECFERLETTDAAPEMPGDVDRRRFLSASLMVGGAAFVLGGAGRLNIARRFGAAEASRDALDDPRSRRIRSRRSRRAR